MSGPLAQDQRGWLVGVGVGGEQADPGDVPAMPGGEASQGLRAVAPVAGDDEGPLGEPTDQDQAQLPHQFRGRLVPGLQRQGLGRLGLGLGLGLGLTAGARFGLDLGLVLGRLAPGGGLGLRGGLGLLRAARQRHQHRQRPGPTGDGEFHQDGQDDPFVPPPVGGVGMGRAHRVARTALAVDLGPAMLVAGVVAGQGDRPVGDPRVADPPGQDAGQVQARPAALGPDAVRAGGMAFGQVGGGAEQVAAGAATGGEDGGDQQHEDALGGGFGEDRGERTEDGLGKLG
jgi:hypothetical protein